MCLGYTRSATVQPQGVHIDILKGLKEVEIMTSSLQTARDSIDAYHSEWYKKACSIASKVDAAVKCPRIGGKQQHRATAASDNVSTHYKVNIAISFLDHFLEEIKKRFENKNCVAIKAISIVPSVMLQQYRSAKNVGEKRNHQEAFAEQPNKDISISEELSDNLNVAASSSTSLSRLENNSSHGGETLIQRLDKEWKKDLLLFCHQ
eukprot:Seg2851.1 transcript_id=Seg2851.1/GoldUCD/mRNA.D3Y31 product="52 kDa repressor of the inhibitor of the protein kinase" protein_id=Seg2851.1/GoldUCD/D3Y31